LEAKTPDWILLWISYNSLLIPYLEAKTGWRGAEAPCHFFLLIPYLEAKTDARLFTGRPRCHLLIPYLEAKTRKDTSSESR